MLKPIFLKNSYIFVQLSIFYKPSHVSRHCDLLIEKSSSKGNFEKKCHKISNFNFFELTLQTFGQRNF